MKMRFTWDIKDVTRYPKKSIKENLSNYKL